MYISVESGVESVPLIPVSLTLYMILPVGKHENVIIDHIHDESGHNICAVGVVGVILFTHLFNI